MGNQGVCCNSREQEKQGNTIPKYDKSVLNSSFHSSESLSTFSIDNKTDTIYLECERKSYDSEKNNKERNSDEQISVPLEKFNNNENE